MSQRVWLYEFCQADEKPNRPVGVIEKVEEPGKQKDGA